MTGAECCPRECPGRFPGCAANCERWAQYAKSVRSAISARSRS